MTPRPRFAVMAALVLAVAACGPGGASGTSPSSAAASPVAGSCPTAPAPGGTPDGWDVASQRPSVFPQIINPSGAIACGPTRLMFSFLDAQNVPVGSPDRTVEVALFDLGAQPAQPASVTKATFIWAIEPTVGVYVVNADFPTAGAWGAEFRTAAPDAATESIRVTFDVQPHSTVVAVGDPAPSTDTPTLADVGGDVSKISTDDQPVEAFYETSEADALAAKQPFVLVFATPKFCKSAQCGPTLDRVKPIAAAHPGVTFINVEPYELQTVDGQLQPVLTKTDPPDLTPTAATDAWRLLAEPWVFVVDRGGIVTASFLLIFSDEELDTAVAAVQ